MANTTRGYPRRTFLLGVGGGAATMSIAWGVSGLGLPFLEPGDDSPIPATLDAYAEYDGWLVTPEDKARMVLLVEFTDGWYARETGGGSSWRWTQQTATLAFPNPQTGDVPCAVETERRLGSRLRNHFRRLAEPELRVARSERRHQLRHVLAAVHAPKARGGFQHPGRDPA